MLKNILEKLYQKQYLNKEESQKLFEYIIEGKLSPIQLTAILIILKIRGESYEEIIGAINALLKKSKFFPRPNYLFADITGTGGDNNKFINVSTISAIVAASSNYKIKIAKHGNHGISSEVGSADLIKKLKIPFNITPLLSKKMLDELGICFLYSPYYHKGFQHTLPIRKILKTRTLFNIIGPLINPAKPPVILIGVYDLKLASMITEILKLLKYQHTIIFHCGGMDEILLHAPIHITELYKNNIEKYTLTAEDFGLNSYPKNTIYNLSRSEKYDIAIKLLKGKAEPIYKETIAANVAVLLKLFGYKNLKENVKSILNIIDEGIPYSYLTKLIQQVKEYNE